MLKKHPYFKGQILALLNFSGIEEQLCKTGTIQLINEKQIEVNWDYFRVIIESFFNENGLKPEFGKDYILHRALMTKSNEKELDYFLPISSGYSFLEQNHRDVSWRRFLFADNLDDNYSMRITKRTFFKELISDENFDRKNIKNSLEKIISNSDRRPSYHQYFIDNPKLLISAEILIELGYAQLKINLLLIIFYKE